MTEFVNATRAWLKRNLSLWRILYWMIAIATFRHTTHGFATLEHGSLALGALSAIAIDIGMIHAAEQLRGVADPDRWLVAGLLLSAFGSFFAQLLYAVLNVEAMVVAPGAAWLEPAASSLVDARVIIMPLILPLLAIVYSFASGGHAVAVQDDANDKVRIIALTGRTKTARCQELAEIAPDMARAQIAELVGCDLGTVSRALAASGNGKS